MSWGDKHTLATMMTMMMTVGIKDVKMYFKGQQRHASWECPHFFDDGNDNLDADGDDNAYEEDEEGPAIFEEPTVCA